MILIKPHVEELVVGRTLNRRHLTKGQRAMAVAKLTPDAKHGDSRIGGKTSLGNELASKGAVSQGEPS